MLRSARYLCDITKIRCRTSTRDIGIPSQLEFFAWEKIPLFVVPSEPQCQHGRAGRWNYHPMYTGRPQLKRKQKVCVCVVFGVGSGRFFSKFDCLMNTRWAEIDEVRCTSLQEMQAENAPPADIHTGFSASLSTVKTAIFAKRTPIIVFRIVSF